jgi:L-threonylcarbamoyladenylate synthase
LKTTRFIRLKTGRVPAGVLREVQAVLTGGGTVVFPTDTVYGLAADIFRPEAIRRLYALKGRSYRKRIPFLAADMDQVRPLVEPPSARLQRLLRDYWPGPLTVVFPTSAVGRWTAGGKDTLALRVPDHPATRAILRAVGHPLAATSANLSGRPDTTTGRAAAKIFAGRVDLILDGGPCPGGKASTVLNAVGPAWTLEREGAVTKRELLRYL